MRKKEIWARCRPRRSSLLPSRRRRGLRAGASRFDELAAFVVSSLLPVVARGAARRVPCSEPQFVRSQARILAYLPERRRASRERVLRFQIVSVRTLANRRKNRVASLNRRTELPLQAGSSQALRTLPLFCVRRKKTARTHAVDAHHSTLTLQGATAVHLTQTPVADAVVAEPQPP